MWGLRDDFLYGFSSRLLGASVMLFTFISTIVVYFPVEPMTSLAMGTWPNNGGQYGFHLVELRLNPIRKWLVSSMPLSHWWVCLDYVKPVTVVTWRAQNWVWLMIIFLLWYLVYNLPERWMLACREEACRSVPAWFHHVLWHICGDFSNEVLP